MKISVFTHLFFACCATLAAADGPYRTTSAVPEAWSTGFNSITEDQSRELLAVIAGAEFAGRGTGQEGYIKAATWFAERLATYGFQPGGPEGSWFQNVPFVKLSTRPDHCGIRIGESDVVTGDALGISQFIGEFHHDLPVTLARFTGKPPEISEGKFKDRLLVVQSTERIRPTDTWVTQGQPAAIIIISASTRWRNEAVLQQSEPLVSIPAVEITAPEASALAKACGADAAFFGEQNPADTLILDSSQVANVSMAVDREAIDVPNVIGWYPGSDESLRHEHVAIGAHLDHLGIQRGEVYPGADDNGSGSTAILQIARAIHENPVKPKRSVLLMAFCAEERGLLGSKHYANNPVHPLADMICMLNIDMIGRNEETADEPASANETSIHLVGSKRISTELHDLTIESNQYVGFDFEYDEERVYTRSDHASFAAQGIPITFLFGGFSPFYHKPIDTLDGINFSKIANAARLNFVTLMLAAEHGHFKRNDPEPAAAGQN